MKVEIKNIKLLLLVIFSVFNTALFANTVDKSTIHCKNNAHLTEIVGAGVNLSLLEHTWEHAEDLLRTDMAPKLDAIRKSGFQTVRIPVAFDMFLQPNSSNLQIELIDKLGEAYNTCEKLGLHMIITYHYGKIYYGSDNRYSERDRVMWMWKQLQNKFRGMGYDKLFFELYNEPTEERNAWKEDITYLVNGLRWEEKERYYIIGGTNYNNADELLDLGKLSDDKVLYTFHYYEPYLFTHQGAEWVKDRTALSNIPYPYDKNKMPPLIDSTIGSAVEKDYAKYPAEGTKEFMMLRIRLIAAECKKRNMPLICTETGVINQVEDKYRGNYLEDVTSIMDELGIPTLLWDYDQRFSVIKPNGKLLKEVKQWLDSKR